jgi:hypothetical protein
VPAPLNNDINPVKSMGLLAGGQANLSRITSTTAWWVKTDAPEGLKLAMRRGLEKSPWKATSKPTACATRRPNVTRSAGPIRAGVYGTPGI